MRVLKLAALAALAWVGLAQSDTQVSIDRPRPDLLAFSGMATFGGWALNDNQAVLSVTASIDNDAPVPVPYGGTRGDVCAVYPGRPDCPNVGWNYALDTTQLTNGSHMLTVTASTASGASATQSSQFIVVNAASATPGLGLTFAREYESPFGTLGNVDGVNTVFTLAFVPAPTLAESLAVWLNGVKQREGLDYRIAGQTITFVDQQHVQVGTRVEAEYWHQ
jgi:hypothetical protein